MRWFDLLKECFVSKWANVNISLDSNSTNSASSKYLTDIKHLFLETQFVYLMLTKWKLSLGCLEWRFTSEKQPSPPVPALYFSSCSFSYLCVIGLRDSENHPSWTADRVVSVLVLYKEQTVPYVVLSLYILTPPSREKKQWKRGWVSGKQEKKGNEKCRVWSLGTSCHLWLKDGSRMRSLRCSGSPNLHQTLFYLRQENDTHGVVIAAVTARPNETRFDRSNTDTHRI